MFISLKLLNNYKKFAKHQQTKTPKRIGNWTSSLLGKQYTCEQTKQEGHLWQSSAGAKEVFSYTKKCIA